MKTKFLASILMFIGVQTSAAPIIVGGQGFSSAILSGTPIFLGGMVGESPTGDGITTVNTCDRLGSLEGCNTNSIYGNLQLTLQAGVTRRVGNLLVARASDNLAIGAVRSTASSVSVTWNSLCFNFTQPSSCQDVTGTAAAKFKLFADENMNGMLDASEESSDFFVKFVHLPQYDYDFADGTLGLADFKLYPANESVYFDELVAPTGNLFMPWGAYIKALRIFISDKDMDHATPYGGLETTDLLINGDGTLASSQVDGLKNGKLYFFRTALVDEAGNVALYLPAPGEKADCDSGLSTCRYSAKPTAGNRPR